MASVWIKQRIGKNGLRFVVGYRLGGRAARDIHVASLRSRADAERLRERIRLSIASGEIVKWPMRAGNRNERVYFIRLGDLVKIGVSIAPERRARGLNASLLHVEDGGRQRERELHEAFAHLRVSGEWFRLDPRIERYIARSAP